MPTQDFAHAAEDAVHKAAKTLTGQVPGTDYAMGHPIHPATVHWPIAFLSTCFAATTLELLPSALRSSAWLPNPSTAALIAHWSAGAGVVTAMPAIITGLGEAYELIRSEYKIKGSWEKVVDSAWNMRDNGGRKIKMTIKHASLNDIAVGLAAWTWYSGYKYPGEKLSTLNYALNAVAFPALMYAAMLGGRMVYEYAMGVQRQGSGKEVKEKSS